MFLSWQWLGPGQQLLQLLPCDAGEPLCAQGSSIPLQCILLCTGVHA